MLIIVEKLKENLFVSANKLKGGVRFSRQYGITSRGRAYTEQWVRNQTQHLDHSNPKEWVDLPFCVFLFANGKKMFAIDDGKLFGEPKKLVNPVNLFGLKTVDELGFEMFQSSGHAIRYRMNNQPQEKWGFEVFKIDNLLFARKL